MILKAKVNYTVVPSINTSPVVSLLKINPE